MRLTEERLPLQEQLEEIRQTMQLECLNQPVQDYLGQLEDIRKIPGKLGQKEQIITKMQKLKSESVDGWELRKRELQEEQDAKKAQIVKVQETIWNYQKEIEKLNEELLQAETGIMEQRRKLGSGLGEELGSETAGNEAGGQSRDIESGERTAKRADRYEQEFQKYLAGRKSVNYDYLKRQRLSDLYPLREAEEEAYQKLVENVRFG